MNFSNCTDGEFRLSEGESDNQGRVEYCYRGDWTAMCSLTMQTARIVCKSLGYMECVLLFIFFCKQCCHYCLLVNAGKVIGDERFGRLVTANKFHSLSCFSSDNKLSECLIQTSCTPTTCSTQYGIICKSK